MGVRMNLMWMMASLSPDALEESLDWSEVPVAITCAPRGIEIPELTVKWACASIHRKPGPVFSRGKGKPKKDWQL